MNLKTKKTISQISFIELCQKTGLFEYGPTKGTIFLPPNGYYLWMKMQNYLDCKFADLGVENVYFPSLIPVSLFEKEKKHIQGFNSEFFIISQVGSKPIKDPLILRPTSETVFSFYFQKVINSYRDLPLLLNQWVSVWRWEQNPNPFLRNMEFLWQEGHTLHSNEQEALDFCQQIRKKYQVFFTDYLFIPVFVGQKSELEKFAGAKITWTLETLLPDGQFLQLATTHYFGQNFTKEFKIQFLNQNNKQNYPHQTSWGVSTRAIAALVQIHCDQLGLVLPFDLAKYQLAVLPIYYSKDDVWQKKKIDDYCQTIKQKLTKFNLNLFKRDNQKQHFSTECKKTELIGVPIRLEIGTKELNEQTVTYVLRSNLKKETIKLEIFIQKFSDLVKQMNQDIFQKANKKLIGQVVQINNFDEYVKIKKNKAFQVNFCNQIKCEEQIKLLTKTVSRFLWKNIKNKHSIYQKCFKCQKQTDLIAIFGRSY